MKLDAIRFCIGPWNGRYSSVWRIWSNPGDDNVYLGVRTLLRYLKVSLHETGKFRVAFVEEYNQKLVMEGKNRDIDRAFLKWDKVAVVDGTIMQALDIHFPLLALSTDVEPETKKGKKQFIIQPDKGSLGENDTITVKVLFHRHHPDDEVFIRSLGKKNLIPVFYIELSNGEFITVTFGYSKKFPINLSKEEQKKYAVLLRNYFNKSNKGVGDKIDNLTIQIFQMGRPPSIYNVGNVSAHWESQDKLSMSVGLKNGSGIPRGALVK